MSDAEVMVIFIVLCLLCTALNLFFQSRKRFATAAVFKMIASSCFVGLALYNGATQNLFGTLLLAAFLLSWIGDACLIRRGRGTAFLAGLVSFLIAHVAFAAGFLVRGLNLPAAAIAAVVIALFGYYVLTWLSRHDLSQKMKAPVVAYVAVIGLMVTFAVSTGVHSTSITIVSGAILFTISDLFVARERFVRPGFINSVSGHSLYFIAQLILASSIV